MALKNSNRRILRRLEGALKRFFIADPSETFSGEPYAGYVERKLHEEKVLKQRIHALKGFPA